MNTRRIVFALAVVAVGAAGVAKTAYAEEGGEGDSKYRKLSITPWGAPACVTAGLDCIVT